MNKDNFGVAEKYTIPDKLWDEIQPLLPAGGAKKKSGRPRMDDRQAFTAIVYILRTGCQWNAMPRSLGASSTVHDRFQAWQRAGFFERLWREGLYAYDELVGLDWEWLAMDGAITKAPLGEKETGANPTDRGKSGTKRSVLVEARGLPLALTIAGAHRHDVSLLEDTLESFGMEIIVPTYEEPQHLCLDAAYDAEWVYDVLEELGYTPHIRSRYEEKSDKLHIPGYRARRWVVERTHSWFNRFRRLLIRWEKKSQNYLAFLHIACAIIAYRSCGLGT